MTVAMIMITTVHSRCLFSIQSNTWLTRGCSCTVGPVTYKQAMIHQTSVCYWDCHRSPLCTSATSSAHNNVSSFSCKYNHKKQ